MRSVLAGITLNSIIGVCDGASYQVHPGRTLLGAGARAFPIQRALLGMLSNVLVNQNHSSQLRRA